MNNVVLPTLLNVVNNNVHHCCIWLKLNNIVHYWIWPSHVVQQLELNVLFSIHLWYILLFNIGDNYEQYMDSKTLFNPIILQAPNFVPCAWIYQSEWTFLTISSKYMLGQFSFVFPHYLSISQTYEILFQLNFVIKTPVKYFLHKPWIITPQRVIVVTWDMVWRRFRAKRKTTMLLKFWSL